MSFSNKKLYDGQTIETAIEYFKKVTQSWIGANKNYVEISFDKN